MTLEKHVGYQFAGKTGSCNNIGWFVGFIVKEKHTQVFAFNIKGEGASGAEAKKIALKYFKDN
jgi:beta-lactamase class D